jgi:hypothetical protein
MRQEQRRKCAGCRAVGRAGGRGSWRCPGCTRRAPFQITKRAGEFAPTPRASSRVNSHRRSRAPKGRRKGTDAARQRAGEVSVRRAPWGPRDEQGWPQGEQLSVDARGKSDRAVFPVATAATSASRHRGSSQTQSPSARPGHPSAAPARGVLPEAVTKQSRDARAYSVYQSEAGGCSPCLVGSRMKSVSCQPRTK